MSLEILLHVLLFLNRSHDHESWLENINLDIPWLCVLYVYMLIYIYTFWGTYYFDFSVKKSATYISGWNFHKPFQNYYYINQLLHIHNPLIVLLVEKISRIRKKSLHARKKNDLFLSKKKKGWIIKARKHCYFDLIKL